MKFVTFKRNGQTGLAVQTAGGALVGACAADKLYPGPLSELIRKGARALDEAGRALSCGELIAPAEIEFQLPFEPGKIICVGLNYLDHAAESSMALPEAPALFTRFRSSIVAHASEISRPGESEKFDYEGELVVVIGAKGRRISKENALSFVAGYSAFNDGSIRDFQLRTTQWTMGKNFDRTGSFGPVFVTANELPPGAQGLDIETRLNGLTVQRANTSDLIFDVASLISMISVGITLDPGDLIVTGTPSGVGAARKPPLFMKSGDVCEVEIAGIGILRNLVSDDQPQAR